MLYSSAGHEESMGKSRGACVVSSKKVCGSSLVPPPLYKAHCAQKCPLSHSACPFAAMRFDSLRTGCRSTVSYGMTPLSPPPSMHPSICSSVASILQRYHDDLQLSVQPRRDEGASRKQPRSCGSPIVSRGGGAYLPTADHGAAGVLWRGGAFL